MRNTAANYEILTGPNHQKYEVAFEREDNFNLVRSILTGNLTGVNTALDTADIYARESRGSATTNPGTLAQQLYQRIFSNNKDYTVFGEMNKDTRKSVADFMLLQKNPEIIKALYAKEPTFANNNPSSTLLSALRYNNPYVVLHTIENPEISRVGTYINSGSLEKLREHSNYRGHQEMLEMLKTIEQGYPEGLKERDRAVLSNIHSERSTLESTMRAREKSAYLRGALYATTILFAYCYPIMFTSMLALAVGTFAYRNKQDLMDTVSINTKVMPFVFDSLQGLTIDAKIITEKAKELYHSGRSFVERLRTGDLNRGEAVLNY